MTTDLVNPLQVAFFDAIGNNAGKPRNKSLYTTEEKSVLGKYKDEYRKKTTTEERHNMLRNHILVDIFNYWSNKGEVNIDICAEDLSQRIKVSSRTLTK
jgi:hypothetical protein